MTRVAPSSGYVRGERSVARDHSRNARPLTACYLVGAVLVAVLATIGYGVATVVALVVSLALAAS